MKYLSALFLFLLISCGDPEENAFNNCIKELKGEKYEGIVLDEVGASLICQRLKKRYPDVFKKAKGKIFSYLKREN